MTYEDDAENARAALRALWAASGQLDSSESLGEEQEFSGVNIPQYASDGKGGQGGNFGSERHHTIGLDDFAAHNEATFDRGEAAAKLKSAWKSTLIAEGKMGSEGKSLKSAAKETAEKLKESQQNRARTRPGSDEA
ncbi:MAG TPA: hypothetical protein VHJ78_00080 [Actinomycetota bacterium]|nr:hypothetical protein [Actinomycetota bacterium]